jgi:hypothetical protein
MGLTIDRGGYHNFLIEGAGEAGKVKLVFTTTVTYPNFERFKTERRQEIDLELLDFKNFYSRYDIDPSAQRDVSVQHFPDAGLTHDATIGERPFFSADDKIVLIHGWDMSGPWKTAFAETAFKRLYWQGARGEFVAFNWPTLVNEDGPRELPGDLGSSGNLTYTASEFQAYRSGLPLMNFLASLSGRKHLLAHSMGNVVSAEALRLWSRQNAGPLVNTYVAMEAAISASAYGVNSTAAFNISKVVGRATISWNARLLGSSSEDLLRYWSAGFPGVTPTTFYMSGAQAAAGRWVNMYNPLDAATNQAWRANNVSKFFVNRSDPEVPNARYVNRGAEAAQIVELLTGIPVDPTAELADYLLLPPPQVWPYRYVIKRDAVNGNRYYRVPYAQEGVFIEDQTQWVDLTPGLVGAVGSPGRTGYEILAFLSMANAETVGNLAMGGAPLPFQANIDIRQYGMPNGADAFQNHSFQFHHSSPKTFRFWQRVKLETGVKSTY